MRRLYGLQDGKIIRAQLFADTADTLERSARKLALAERHGLPLA
jgi:hypothetical protein